MEPIKDTNENEDDTFAEMKIGDETCLVNRKTLEKLHTFEDLHPYYDTENGLHNVVNGKIRPLNPSVIGFTKLTKKYGEHENELHCQDLCASRRKHIEGIIRNVHSNGFDNPSMIQSIGLFPLIDGKDTMIQFKSGTGKTMTFLVGLLWGLDMDNKTLQYIFLTSTHEVAKQIYELVQKLVPQANSVLCIPDPKKQDGGFKPSSSAPTSLSELRNKFKTAQVIVGTIGKTYDLLCVKKLVPTFNSVRSFCADEFDALVSPQKNRGLNSHQIKPEEQLEDILGMLPSYTQRVFFSATVIPESGQIAQSYFRKYDAEVGKPFMLLLTENNFIVNGIRHYYVGVSCYEDKRDALVEIWGRMRNGGQGIIFVNRTNTAELLKKDLETELKNIKFSIFYGKMDGNNRDKTFDEFTKGICRYMISTDVLSRGIDVQGINFIINFDMPEKIETYIHRIGRSGRYGRKGIAINFVLSTRDTDEMQKVNEINLKGSINEMRVLPENIEDLL